MPLRLARALGAGFGIAIGVAGAVFAGGCSSSDGSTGDAEPTCLPAPVSTECTPFVAPTFDEIYANILNTDGKSNGICAESGCHAGANAQAGLRMDDINTAYSDLLATNDAHDVRVKPNDLQCGKVLVRLETAGKPYSMPPGGQLDESMRCSIGQWIAAGAKPPSVTGANP